MKRVLLTGATGLIGSCAINPLIERGFDVHAVSSKDILPKPLHENLTWHRADLLDFSSVKELVETIAPSHLLHFAWFMKHGSIMNAPENLDWVAASLNLVKNFQETGGKRLVLCGTVSEYEASEAIPLKEHEAKLNPDSLYGATKKCLGEVAAKYAETSGLSFAWGRAFFQFGRNEAPNRLVASVSRSLLRGEIAETSHGNQIRDYLCADDTGDAFAALLDAEIEGFVNIASGEARTLREIILEIAHLLGKTEDSIEFGAVKVSPNEPPHIVADITRLKNEVKWKPSKTFSERLKETVEWHEENS